MLQFYPRPMTISLAKILKIVVILACLFNVSKLSAQSLSFKNYELVNGGEGQKGAEYRFTGVINDASGNPIADCIVRIDNISPGVQLKNIDIPSEDNDAAFQPVVEHKNTIGPSWIEFNFSFIPHSNHGAQEMYQLPLLAASIYGLNGFQRAQEFAECDLGRNSQVVYETEITNLMVTRNGNTFRAENKWGVETNKIPTSGFNEKFSLLNQQVSGLKVKFGVNRKQQSWAGISKYNLSLSNSAPDMSIAYQPSLLAFDAKLNQNVVSLEWNAAKPESVKNLTIEKSADGAAFTSIGNLDLNLAANVNGQFSYVDQSNVNPSANQVFYRLRMVTNTGKEEFSTIRKVNLTDIRTQVQMQISSKYVQDVCSVSLPENWIGKEMVIEIFNANGEMVKKITEHKALQAASVEMDDLADGSYVIRASCGKEFAVQYAIRANQL
jgi:hypothetical protein